MFGPGHRLVKKNLAGRGLTNIEKHCSRICSALWSLLYRSSAAKPPPCSNVPTPNPTLRQSNLTNIPWAATLISAIFCTGQWPGGWGSWAVWTDPSVAICRGCNRTTCLFYTILQDEQFKLFKVQWITSNPMTQLLLFFTAGMQSDMWDLKCGGAETAPPQSMACEWNGTKSVELLWQPQLSVRCAEEMNTRAVFHIGWISAFFDLLDRFCWNMTLVEGK